MPKKGFKTLTIKEEVYDRWETTYKKNKHDLAQHGINSLAAYVAHTLIKKSEETLIKFRFEVLEAHKDLIVLKDNNIDRVVEIKKVDGKLFCFHCDRAQSSHCAHIGFCYSLWQIYRGPE